MLVLAVPEDLHELFENRRLTAIAPLRELCRVVIVTVYFALMLIITILCTKNCWTYRTSEMFDVIFPFQSRYIGTTQGPSTFVTQ